MNLKKILAAAVLFSAMTIGAMAKNHPYGMDIAVSPFGVETSTLEWKVGNITVDNKEVGINLFALKINTYICPWLDNHLGIYGSFGILPGVHVADNADNASFVVGAEFMVGPAFGIDLGDSSVRFQVSTPFHLLLGGGKTYRANANVEQDYFIDAFGMGITPQFRFGADKRCSFVAGMDFVFDFAGNCKIGNTWADPDSFFRFAWTPYLGLGINFGD